MSLFDLSHSMRAPQLYPPDVSLAIASRSHGDGLGGRPGMLAGYRGLGGADGLGIGKFGSKKVLVAFGPIPLPAGVTSYVQDGGFGGGEGGGCEGGAQKHVYRYGFIQQPTFLGTPTLLTPDVSNSN